MEVTEKFLVPGWSSIYLDQMIRYTILIYSNSGHQNRHGTWFLCRGLLEMSILIAGTEMFSDYSSEKNVKKCPFPEGHHICVPHDEKSCPCLFPVWTDMPSHFHAPKMPCCSKAGIVMI